MKNLLPVLALLLPASLLAQLSPVPSGVIHWSEVPVKTDGLRESRKIAEGTTPEFDYFEIHATTQQKGARPRPPHAQKDREEVMIIKEGTAKCIIGDDTAILGKGSVQLIPPMLSQSIENVGDGPLTYYVFVFRSRSPMNLERSRKAGGSLLLPRDSMPYQRAGFKGTRRYFDRPTAMTENFEMHITELYQSGPSHAPHQHKDTEIILLVEGAAEMTIDGQHYEGRAGDLFFIESGKVHGISNSSAKPCKYFAFKWR